MKKIKENRRNGRRRFVVASSIAAAVVVITLMIGLTWINHDSPLKKTRQSTLSMENEWKPSSYFTVNGHQLLGNKGKVGLIKMNVTSDSEPFITSKRGIVYQIYFWGNSNTFNGKYKMMATNKDTNEVIQLYEWPIEVTNNQMGADAILEYAEAYCFSRSNCTK